MFESCLAEYDDDGPTYHKSRTAKARKPWRCCECHGAISVGERYECDENVYDGEWSTFRTCLTCARIRESLCKGGFVYGMLWESIIEAYCCDPDNGHRIDEAAREAMVPESYFNA